MATETQTAENFKRRGKSYKDGMLLLITHLTDQDWKVGDRFPARLRLLAENIESIYKDYSDNLHENASFTENKKHFNRFLEKYNNILLQHTTLENSFQSLLLAERCSVWKEGRECFKTSVPLVQSETPLVDSETLRQEYEKISSESPLWFQRLALWQQDFIKANWKALYTKPIPSSLRSVPGVANLSRHDFFINNVEALTYFRHATPYPIDLLKQTDTEEEGFRLTCLNLASQIKLSLEHQFNKSNVGEIREAVILTQSLLSPGTAATFKSQHISDSSDNDTKIYEMKEKAVEYFQQAFQNPDTLINSEIKKCFFTEAEQGSALYYKDFLAKFGFVVQDNGCLEYKGHSFGKITLLSTNHPLNVLRRFGVHPEQSQRNDLNTALLLGAVERYLSPLMTKKVARINVEKRKPISEVFKHFNSLLKELKDCAEKENISSDKKEDLIKMLEVILSSGERTEFDKNTLRLLDALQTLLSIPSGQGSLGVLGFLGIGDKQHRQSLVSAMEAIIINCIGATHWMACKSGKDRTGGASAACDAAAMFYELRGRYPRYEDADRALYLKLYKNLFESGHHQEVASQNALGASGLIKSNLFLPDDMKLDAQQVQLGTELARLNKPKGIHKGLAEVFNHQPLGKELQGMKHKIEKKDKGAAHILIDWQRGLKSESYFILGKSIKELRNGEEFKNEADLMDFIEVHLLNKIQDNNLKEYYLALRPFAFHQGGFSHVFSTLGFNFCNDVRLHSGTVYKQPDFKINFSPLRHGVQIEEITTCTEKFKPELDGNLVEVPLEEGGYHYQTHSCISVTLNPVENKGYKLQATIKSVVVDCEAEELKSYFFKKTGLLAVLTEFFASLVAALKGFFKGLGMPKSAKEGVLDESWLNSLNPKAAKPESAPECAPESQQALNLGNLVTTASEADSRLSERIPSQEGVFCPPVSECKSSLLEAHGVFKLQIDPKAADRHWQPQLEPKASYLGRVGGL